MCSYFVINVYYICYYIIKYSTNRKMFNLQVRGKRRENSGSSSNTTASVDNEGTKLLSTEEKKETQSQGTVQKPLKRAG